MTDDVTIKSYEKRLRGNRLLLIYITTIITVAVGAEWITTGAPFGH